MRRPRISIPVLPAVILVAVGVAVALLTGCRFEHPEVGVKVAHAAPGDPNQGCAKCHTTPVVATCVSCHPSPPTPIRSIVFPHHDAASGKPITNCQMCHGGSDSDARYVKVLKASMAYCKQCHQLTHSAGF